MPLLPGLQPFVDTLNAIRPAPVAMSVAETRSTTHVTLDRSIVALQNTEPPVASETDVQLAVTDGEITVRIYRPAEGVLPVHLYFHGGGFWLGTLKHYDNKCRAIASGTPCVVISVDYRLAPESKFPTAVDDCYAALVWTAQNAAELGVDATRLSVGGDSAGGDLAAAVALMVRDCGGPRITLQILEIPVTDLTMSQPSIVENAAGPLLTRKLIEQYVGYYLDDPADAHSPYASPLLATDLSDLPPALVMTAELDPLRDEGEAYARRLLAAGCQAELVRWNGQLHGTQGFAKLIPEEARAYQEKIIKTLQAAFAG